MKKLLLIRHAKATHETGYQDFERPLTPSGLQDAERQALRLQAKGIRPQMVVSSPALRTAATANIFTEILSLPKALTNKAIYDAAETTLINIINAFTDEYDFIALVGHNPAISQVLYTLSGAVKDVPPCTVALIEFEENSWAEVYEGAGKLTYYDSPKN